MASLRKYGCRNKSGDALDLLYSLKDTNDATIASVSEAISNFDKISDSFFRSHSEFISAAEK